MIPTVTDLQSAPMAHRYGDLYALPGLTNFLGCVQMDLDLTGLRSLNFPPFATSDVQDVPRIGLNPRSMGVRAAELLVARINGTAETPATHVLSS